MKKLLSYLVMLTPTALLLALPYYALFFTNIPQAIYMDSVRNIFFDCIDFVDDAYVYKMRPGRCHYRNLEYDVTTLSDRNGFRKSETVGKPEIAVIGDSHAYGFGVADDQTFAYLLEAEHRRATVNLAIGSYATARELEALRKYGGGTRYVVLQYCENDRGENAAFLNRPHAQFTAEVEAGWKRYVAGYQEGKAQGIFKPLKQLGIMLGNLSFERKSAWRKRLYEARDVNVEAALFAQIVDAYRPVLAGRRLIVLDSSGWGINPPAFKAVFSAELAKRDWLEYRVVDTASLLSEQDYYFFDDHLRPEGHRRIADAIAREIADWERRER